MALTKTTAGGPILIGVVCDDAPNPPSSPPPTSFDPVEPPPQPPTPGGPAAPVEPEYGEPSVTQYREGFYCYRVVVFPGLFGSQSKTLINCAEAGL